MSATNAINFHELKLVDGIHSLILPGANQP